ncbi:ATP-binding protein [Mangrovibacterium lignilyticum]|uniref:ATP-binding protein n=1 Tax=Mangrovibacterium lignilyticum TaxID=2668052 RepID=UPI0013D204BA|nr:ATP-binding protein [Mangrovibacterium lignilyticum]
MKKSIRIPSNFIYLKEVEDFIDDVLGACKLSSKQVAFITLGVCESVNNAINHGNKLDENKYVSLFAEITNEAALFEVHDEGNGFDYTKVPDPTANENIKLEGGRGLFIIHNLVDEVNFKNNGSVIQLKFKLDRAHTLLS